MNNNYNNPNNNYNNNNSRSGRGGRGGYGRKKFGNSNSNSPSSSYFSSSQPLPVPRRQQNQAPPTEANSASSLVPAMMPKRQRIRLENGNAGNGTSSGSNVPRWNGQHRQNGFGNQQRRHYPQQKGRNRQNTNNFRGPSAQEFYNHQNGETSSSAFSSSMGNLGQNGGSQVPAVRSAELSDLPGYSYDPNTKKYYKILQSVPGQPAGSTLHHLRNLAVGEAAVAATSSNKSNRNVNTTNLSALLNKRQIMGGGRGMHQQCVRTIEEGRMRGVRPMPSYSFEVVGTWAQRFDSCQFMDVSEDGRTLLGCWSNQGHDIFSGNSSRVLSFDVKVDKERAKRDSKLLAENPQQLLDTNGRYSCNTYGLQFEPLDNGICLETSNQVLVDMVTAPADRDVTCLLFATASSFYKTAGDGRPKIMTKCLVHLRPIEFNLTDEGRESMGSPIYNAEWTSTEPIWSLCFNSHHMKICVGMEKYARILNVLGGNNFFVSSNAKNVIACQFSKDGNSLFLGRKGADISMLDLRLQSNHCVAELAGSESAGFLHLLRERPNTLLSENFEGKIKLWDLRMRRELMELQKGHKNSAHKLPCFVDGNERFVFCVGEDAIVRCWSLHSGELLCSVNSPRAHIQQKARYRSNSNPMLNTESTGVDFPRVVYSSSWGGRTGNSALLFAVNGDLLVHELQI